MLLGLVVPVFGPGHGFTVLLQLSHLAYDAVTNNLAYFGLPYLLGILAAYYLLSVILLFLALSAIVRVKSSEQRNASS